jgi:hypothetical protein
MTPGYVVIHNPALINSMALICINSKEVEKQVRNREPLPIAKYPSAAKLDDLIVAIVPVVLELRQNEGAAVGQIPPQQRTNVAGLTPNKSPFGIVLFNPWNPPRLALLRNLPSFIGGKRSPDRTHRWSCANSFTLPQINPCRHTSYPRNRVG